MQSPDPRIPGIPAPLARLHRKPQRITITVSAVVVERLSARALVEGRSLSNLAAYLLEVALAPAAGEG